MADEQGKAGKVNSGAGADHSALLKQALRALEQMKQKLAVAEKAAADAADSRARQAVAIVGMGCRFPGGVDGPESFWELLREGREAISEVPADRWDIDAYYDADPNATGKMVTRYGGFLDDVRHFDAAFFGIAPREAAMMDPQQRLLLEVTWQALEGAGIAPRTLAGSATGVYLGVASGDYAQLQLTAGDVGLLDVHYASGNSQSIASGRLSYLLGLKGPSISVDTACSSSLVAVHLACQALRTGECSMAIAGGVNVILAPETTVALSQAKMLAPDGRSKAFDDRADGFARAEGCGVVVLKPLADAERDGDPILAVIRGTALNQDGASSSLTAPNGPSQEELMRAALRNAGMSADRVGYVEAHGTGTSLGDPIELGALGAVYGAGRAPDKPLLVGSLKTNFGHMEAAAGVGGLIKLVLALKHGEIPAHLQLRTLTTHVNWAQLRLDVPWATQAWPTLGDARVGAVSSFGFSGTNAHLVVEAGPAISVAGVQEEGVWLLPVSGQSEAALRAQLESYAEWLGSDSSGDFGWADIAATAGVGRDHYRYRAAVVAGSRGEAAAELLALAGRGLAGHGVAAAPSLCFLFTGQGSEHEGMGLELLERSGVFRAAVARLDAALAGILDVGIAAIWAGNGGELERASLVQPALYAFGWALSELWRSWGVEPRVVMGHSLGEYVAATVAGVMTPEEGVRLVAARGRLTETLAEPGGMVAVVASRDEVAGLLLPGLSVAAVNGPASVVVSGGIEAIGRIEELLRERGLRHKRLRTTHGFHSAALEPMLETFEAEAAKVQFKVPEVRWVSNLTGKAVERDKPVNAKYWRRHLRETVEFSAGLAAAEAAGAGVFVEIGAEPQLLALADANGIDGGRQVASLSRPAKAGQTQAPSGEWRRLLAAAGRLYALGLDLDWKGMQEGRKWRRVALPGYRFQRQSFWFDSVRRGGASHPRNTSAGVAWTGHPLLGERILTQAHAAVFHARLTAEEPDHLGDHVVLGRRILPGAAYLEMAVAAAGKLGLGGEWSAVEVEFREACVFDEPRLLETVVSDREGDDGRRRFTIASMPGDEAGGDWTVHVTGWLEAGADGRGAGSVENIGEIEDIGRVKAGSGFQWDAEGFYDRFRASGLEFGEALRPVLGAWGSAQESLVEFALMPAVAAEAGRYGVHPIALDACLQAAAALTEGGAKAAPALPANVVRYRLIGDPETLRFATARVRGRQGRSLTVDIRGLDALGGQVLAVEGLTLVQVAVPEPYAGWLHEVVWEKAALRGGLSLEVAEWRAALDRSAKANDVAGFDGWMREFDELCAAWIAECFVEGGLPLAAGFEFKADEAIGRLGVVAEHGRLARRFLEILAESDYLTFSAETGIYRATRKQAPSVEGLRRKLGEAGHPEYAWAERTAGQLLPLLRGEVTAVNTLFSEGGQEIAKRLYRESVVAKIFQPALAEAARQVVARLGGKARVLEVGGGTAATTSYLVPVLGDSVAEYVWTDLGAGFVTAARREFGGHASMRFQTLDLERDPAEQGLAGEKFDVIVASNVVHATADLRRTLRLLRSLVAPGGLLLMMETIGKKQPWVDLTVGFTEGWWRFTDTDLRPDYALLSREGWARILEECGFGAVDLAPKHADDEDDATLSRQCLIAAVAGQAAVAVRALVVSDGYSGGMVTGLVERAKAAGALVQVAESSDSGSALVGEWLKGRETGERAHLFFLPGAELARGGESGLEWQERVLGGALSWMQALLAADAQVDWLVWLVTRGVSGTGLPDGSTLAGFARSVRAEYGDARVAVVDLPGSLGDMERDVERLWALTQSAGETEVQYSLREDGVWVPRLIPRKLAKSDVSTSLDGEESRRLYLPGTGLIEDLKSRIDRRVAPGPGEVEIAIEAAAVNFHEVLSALEQSGSEHHSPPGGECSGRVVRVGEGVTDLSVGDTVVATGWGLMADFATVTRSRVWKRPAGLGAEDAATLLIPYLTARWSLERIAGLRAGERVLIHAGAGGVGLAAIQEARRLGAEVFATAGSEAKRDYLRELGVTAVFDSRSTAFEGEVLAATGFLGVDVVLNSLGGEKIAAGLRTLAPGGRFVELGEKTAWTEEEVQVLRPDVRYHRVHLRAALVAAAPEVLEVISAVLADVEGGLIGPLSWKAFALDAAAEAFRYMAAGQQIGRVLLMPDPELRQGRRKFAGIRRDGAYVVTGGLSGLGLLVVEWLAERGAGCVLALGRGQASAEALETLRRSAEKTKIVTVSCDVGDAEALENALGRIPAEFAVRGVFHSAGALADAGLPQQTWESFRSVLAAKVAGGWNLHLATLNAELDCFVLFSSAAGVLGSRGQANHAAANAYLDGLAHYRRELGLPALSIDWGAWSGVGAAVRHGVVERTERVGVTSIAPAEGLEILGRLLEEDCAQVLVSKVDWRRWAGVAKAEAAANADLLTHLLRAAEPKMALKKAAKAIAAAAESRAGMTGSSWRQRLLEAPVTRQRAMLEAHVEERVRGVLSLAAAESVDRLRPLQEYGLDSLLSIELRNALSADLEAKLSATALFDYPTLGSLTDWLFQDVLKLRGQDIAAPEGAADGEAAALHGEGSQGAFDSLSALSDEEVDRLFQLKMAGMRK